MRTQGVNRRGGLKMVFVFMLLFLLPSGCATRLPWARREGLTSADSAVRRIEKANAQVFDAAWAHMHRNYYDPNFNGQDWVALGREFRPRALAARSERELYGVLDEMLGRLKDKHAVVTTPSMVQLEKSGTSIGLGLETDRIGESWVVTAVKPESGADLAGVRRGWTVLSAYGRKYEAGFERLLTPVDGERGEWVFLDQESQRRVVPITLRFRKRDRVKIFQLAKTKNAKPVVQATDGLTGRYLPFNAFERGAIAGLNETLARYREGNVDRLILDLRGNGGGYEWVLRGVAGMFLPKHTELGSFRARGGTEKKCITRGQPLYEGKLVILVGGNTGSAAEIFAAVLQEKGRAIVVGRPTAGAVLLQFNHRLPDGGVLSCSRFDYRTPAGKRLEHAGVTPDVLVPLTVADVVSSMDKDIEAAKIALRRQTEAITKGTFPANGP